ncbi:DUF3231 family protein [Neobacillus ginsengisoli]|uniref:DUF3231 family protein n=1 Tax=Neobacillus ginsengisoli TaxID=904295 RepID=A0ABT9XYX1_9BACI|nr:DUF3231 family protein [Neobacillus ginsengisoli]MDQ0200762.1 hypothetical protein [Neobacillus ginsengisoli]
MDTIKPIKIGSKKMNPTEKLTAAEMGKLWATFMGNSMSKQILIYFLQHVEDEDIKKLLENALSLVHDFMNTIEGIFEKESFPIPVGFTENDVNLGAPRLFEDEFYVHYLKYAAKAGLSIYNIAIPLVYREDVRNFFIHCMNSTIVLTEQIKEVLMNKGFIIKPPYIPIPEKVKFVKEDFLNGFLGHVRTLHGLEVTHLYDNIENNVTSKALILGFSQVARMEKVRELFMRGKDMTHRAVEQYMYKLHNANLPSPPFLDHLVTTSTISPFSDKLMLFHKVDMFSMKIRAFGNSMAVNGRHDLGFMYTRALMNISLFVEDGAKIMINNGWMEQPPLAVDRDRLASK